MESERKELKRERNIFLEEALEERQREYQEQFKAKKMEVLEEIYLKYQQICMIRQNKQNQTNIFMHLNDEIFTSGKGRVQREEAREE